MQNKRFRFNFAVFLLLVLSVTQAHAATKRKRTDCKSKTLYTALDSSGRQVEYPVLYDSLLFESDKLPGNFLLFIFEMQGSNTLTLRELIKLTQQWENLTSSKQDGSPLYRKLWTNSYANIPRTEGVRLLYAQIEICIKKLLEQKYADFAVTLPNIQDIGSQIDRKNIITRMSGRSWEIARAKAAMKKIPVKVYGQESTSERRTRREVEVEEAFDIVDGFLGEDLHLRPRKPKATDIDLTLTQLSELPTTEPRNKDP